MDRMSNNNSKFAHGNGVDYSDFLYHSIVSRIPFLIVIRGDQPRKTPLQSNQFRKQPVILRISDNRLRFLVIKSIVVTDIASKGDHSLTGFGGGNLWTGAGLCGEA